MKIQGTIFVLLLMLIVSCNRQTATRGGFEGDIPAINLDHIMHLYKEVDLPNGKRGGIIHIYSEYPDYSFEIEPKEGFSCVDDVARAMMIDEIRSGDKPEIQEMYERFAEFLLYMQAENGWFHNFVWNDLSINKTYRTTLAQPDWWSWRAFWALCHFNSNNKELNNRVKSSCKILAGNIFETYQDLEKSTDTIEGVVAPTWLPLGTAGDQAGLVILGLEAYYNNIEKDERSLECIRRFADGLLLTQKGRKEQYPYGAFMSWKNMWHAYGNIQAYAMLRAGNLLNEEAFINAALTEVDYFYPYLVMQDQLSEFSLAKVYGEYDLTNIERYPQIAYGQRPIIWACMEAYKITNDEKYLGQAEYFACWFSGQNPGNHMMYDPKTGRCFDGIVSRMKVNKNSGAESTIEALLSLQVFKIR